MLQASTATLKASHTITKLIYASNHNVLSDSLVLAVQQHREVLYLLSFGTVAAEEAMTAVVSSS